jgi:hypothetical protein
MARIKALTLIITLLVVMAIPAAAFAKTAPHIRHHHGAPQHHVERRARVEIAHIAGVDGAR